MILPDIIGTSPRLLFCGLNAGRESAAAGHYFCRQGNRFWRTLAETGLTPRRLGPDEDALLIDCGIGLTDLMKGSIDGDGKRPTEADRERLRRLILERRPKIVAFLGKKPATAFLGWRRGPLPWGILREVVGDTKIAIVPDTSGANGHFERLKRYWNNISDVARSG